MKRSIFVAIVFIVLSLVFSAAAQVEKCPELDASFTMLEKGNPFLAKYNEITCQDIEARYELGLPYFFGGIREDWLMLPKKCQQATGYYRKGHVYFYGFDCSGFTRWINKQAGKSRHDKLSAMITNWGKYGETNHLAVKDLPYSEIHNYLKVGDFLVGNNDGSRHILMYIGTLSDFGYTAETVPELAEYLDYPLVIHCGKNPFYFLRYSEHIKKNGLHYKPTNGGVTISIVGVPVEKAPYTIDNNQNTFYYFMLDEYNLTIWDVFKCSSYVWFRM